MNTFIAVFKRKLICHIDLFYRTSNSSDSEDTSLADYQRFSANEFNVSVSRFHVTNETNNPLILTQNTVSTKTLSVYIICNTKCLITPPERSLILCLLELMLCFLSEYLIRCNIHKALQEQTLES